MTCVPDGDSAVPLHPSRGPAVGSLTRAIIIILATGGTHRCACVVMYVMQMRKLMLRGEGTSLCHAARRGEARF